MSVPSLPPTAFDEQAAVADIAGIAPRGPLGFFRSSVFRKPAMIFGLTVLIVFILIAIFAPLLEPYDPRAKTGAVYEPPSSAHWLGTDDGGSGHALARHRRLARLADRGVRRSARRHAHRRDDRALVGFLRRQKRHRAHAHHRLRARDPGHPPDDHRRCALRPQPDQHHPHHRDHLLDEHGAAHPRPDEERARAGLRHTRARARRRQHGA